MYLSRAFRPVGTTIPGLLSRVLGTVLAARFAWAAASINATAGRRFRRDDGSISVEYVLAMLTAVTLGGLLVWAVSQEQVRNAMLAKILEYIK